MLQNLSNLSMLTDAEGPRLDAVEALHFADPPVAQTNGNRDPDADEVLFSLAAGSPSLGSGPRNTAVCPFPPAGQLSPSDVLYSQFDSSFCVFARAEDLGLLPTDDLKDIDILPSPAPLAPGARITQVHLRGPSANNPVNPNPLPTGRAGQIAAQVQFGALGVAGQQVIFTEVPLGPMTGNILFAEGAVCDLGGTDQCIGGTRHGQACSTLDDHPVTGCPGATLTTDANGEVGIAFLAQAAGKVLVKVSVVGTTLAAYALFTVGP
jgi:hypothetical protein